MNQQLDPAQLEAVSSEANTVVTAGAGSGKTTVLAERYCWLVESGQAAVEEILALTFTQKAAAEMHERIYRRLSRSQRPGALAQLKDFARAQISTLDSFCSQILRASSFRFGVAADYRYDEPQLRRLAGEEALRLVLSEAGSPAIRELLALHGADRLVNNLFAELALDCLHLGKEIDFQALAARQLLAQKERLEGDIQKWLEAASALGSLEGPASSLERARRALEGLEEAPALAGKEGFAELAARFEGFKLDKARGGEAGQRQLFNDWVDGLRKLKQRIADGAFALGRREILLDAFRLLDRFQAALNRRKREERILSFRDGAEMAIASLGEEESLRRFYLRRFRFILIDEFQDNNQLQKRLLYLLASRPDRPLSPDPGPQDLEPGKLFFVGDEKQSIYRFRGADVSVFKSLGGELKRHGGRLVALEANYRSEPALVRFFNRLFPRILTDSGHPHQAAYRLMSSPFQEERIVPQIHFFFRPASAGEEGRDLAAPQAAEAFALAAFLKDSIQAGLFLLPQGEGTRPARYEDVALLLRSTSRQPVYEQMLRRHGVPFNAISARSFYTEAAVHDLYNLLQLALFPEDRIAFAGLLRSPLVNLSDEAAARLLLSAAAPFQGEEPGIDTEDRLKLKQGALLLDFIRENADRRPLSELIHHFWYRAGYRYGLLRDPARHNRLEIYDTLAAVAEEADRRGQGLADLVDDLRKNLMSQEKLEERRLARPRSPGIQILTIHGAKGLEFPIVVLADMGNRGRPESLRRPFYPSEEHGVLLDLGRGNPLLEEGKGEMGIRESAEIRRLFYVALTRARCHLILSGCQGRRNNEEGRSHLDLLLQGLPTDAESLARALGGSEEQDGYRITYHRIEDQRAAELRHIAAPPLVDLEEASELYRSSPLVERAAASRSLTVTGLAARLEAACGLKAGTEELLPGIGVDPLLREAGLEEAFGNLAHFLLARALAPEETAAQVGQEPDWAGLGIAEDHRLLLRQEADSLCRGFLDSELGRRALGSRRRACELAFLYRFDSGSGPCLLRGQIDLGFTAGTGGERAVLVDFKTERSHRPGEHEAQLVLYSLALSELWGLPVDPYLFLLRGGRAISLPLKSVEGWQKTLRDLIL